jgi:acetate kinase
MNLLVLNAGSASQKCSLFRLGDRLPDDPLEPAWQADINATAPGVGPDELLLTVHQSGREPVRRKIPGAKSRADQLEHLLESLWQEPSTAVISGPEEIQAVGHRVVHGGDYPGAQRIDGAVEKEIERLSALAPLHNPIILEGIRVAQKVLGPRVPQVAVFDTSFHLTMPQEAKVYAGPYAWLDQGIRRYGFHGTSFRFASARAARLLGREGDPGLRLVLAHLGGGCSLAATVGGKSVDTTMGFTPLDGIAMCTRSGAVDPGILLFLLRKNPDLGPDGLEKMLNKESGLAGLSGLPGDTRILLAEAAKGNARAKIAMDVFIHRLRAGFGQMIASLGDRPDAFVFTDAIAEDEPSVRAAVCESFRFLGVDLDFDQNAASPPDADIARPESPSASSLSARAKTGRSPAKAMR